MDRRYGPLLPAVLASLLLPCIGWGQLPNHAVAILQDKIAPVMKVECAPSSSTVQPGQSITLTTKVLGSATNLKYSFSANAGKPYPSGATARLDTTGLSSGTVITASCEVVDSLGRRSLAEATMRVLGADVSHKSAAKPPIFMDKAIADWKNSAGSKAEAPAAKPSHEKTAEIAQKADAAPQAAMEGQAS